jgi:hypothetical protein
VPSVLPSFYFSSGHSGAFCSGVKQLTDYLAWKLGNFGAVSPAILVHTFRAWCLMTTARSHAAGDKTKDSEVNRSRRSLNLNRFYFLLSFQIIRTQSCIQRTHCFSLYYGFCSELWRRYIKIYLVFVAFTSRSTSLLESSRSIWYSLRNLRCFPIAEAYLWF